MKGVSKMKRIGLCRIKLPVVACVMASFILVVTENTLARYGHSLTFFPTQDQCPSSWISFKPEGDQFSVKLPTRPLPKPLDVPDLEGHVYSASDGKVLYTVRSIAYRGNAGGDEEKLADFKNMYEKSLSRSTGDAGMKLSFKGDLSLDDFIGKQFQKTAGGKSSLIRIYVRERQIFVLEVSVADEDYASVKCFLNSFKLDTLKSPLVIRTDTLPQATQSLPYSAKLEASGGVRPYSWTIEAGALPDGLRLSSDGTISGRPAAAGAASFTVRLRDSLGTSTVKQFLIIVVQPLPPPSCECSPSYRVENTNRAAVLCPLPKLEYTNEALKNRFSGNAKLRLQLSAQGKVTITEMVESAPYGLMSIAIEKAKIIKFCPALLDGRPVDSTLTLKLEWDFGSRTAIMKSWENGIDFCACGLGYEKEITGDKLNHDVVRCCWPYNRSPADQGKLNPDVVRCPMPEMEYTKEGRKHRYSGEGLLRLEVSATGKITKIDVVKGLPYGLTDKAIEAANKIRYCPAMKNGIPVDVSRVIPFKFHLRSGNEIGPTRGTPSRRKAGIVKRIVPSGPGRKAQ